MNSKWYLSTLVLILALFGFSQQQHYVPNQEIVVQFANDEVTAGATQNAIAIVKEQLQQIGADQIQVRELSNGKLKITYYSNIDVASIKELFSEENNIALGYATHDQDGGSTNFPSNKDFSNYDLNVAEIQFGFEAVSHSKGHFAEPFLDNQRYFNPDLLYFFHPEVDVREYNRIERTAYGVQRELTLAVDNSSHNIPEVRAGPFC